MSTTLAFIGDVMLGRLVDREIGHGHAPDSFWGECLPLLRSADAVLANLECAITEHHQAWTKGPKVFHFRARPQATLVLLAAHVRGVSLANNHTLDFDEQGLLDTLHHLDAIGIHHAGAGKTRSEAAAPAIFTAGEHCIGLLSMTDNEPLFAASDHTPGTNYIEIDTKPHTLSRLAADVNRARQQGADIVVLALHWGPNMRQRPSHKFQEFAHAACEHGVDIVFGHSAHIFQGIELYGRKPILYDTGDFLDDYAVEPELRNDWSFLFFVDLTEQGVSAVRLVPVKLEFARVDPATGDDFERICERMKGLCGEFETPVEQTPEGLRITVGQQNG